MKKAIRQKMLELSVVLALQLIFTLPFYTANVFGLTISNVRVSTINSNSAIVEWSTEDYANGKVRYGVSPSSFYTQRHDNYVKEHSMTLFNGITSDTTYYFAVESVDPAGNTAVDNNSNNFYTFKTPDITPPPAVTGLGAVSFTSSSIFIAWNSVSANDLSHYLIYRNKAVIGNSSANFFNDTNLDPGKEYSYKAAAVDTSGNIGGQSDTIMAATYAIDSAAPAISQVSALSSSDTSANINWFTNEEANSFVYYGLNKTDKTRSRSEFELNHTIVIDQLTKGKTYIFIVSSCDSSGNCANYTGNILAGKDTTPPSINTIIPKCSGRRLIDIIGTTEPFSKISLYVNSMIMPYRSLSGEETPEGRFVFSQIPLQDANIIKITAEDKSGNKNEKTYEVRLDLENPIIQLNDIPSIVSKMEVVLTGSSNEPVDVKIYVDPIQKEIRAPSKIENLSTAKVGTNSVDLNWGESKEQDFSHYVVYRNDIGPIATTNPSSFNVFIDALVDSGRTYMYQVSAVNIYGVEGQKSDALSVTTQSGGQSLGLTPSKVDPYGDLRRPVFFANATRDIKAPVKLNNGDQGYKIKAVFEDCAGNAYTFEKIVALDTQRPDIKITSPPSGAFIYENVANEIDIEGKTKPNARVHLFIERSPLDQYNYSAQISGLPNEAVAQSASLYIPQDQLDSIPEQNLDAKCRSTLKLTNLCRTGADLSTTADASGNFKFERVDLTAILASAARIGQVSPSDFSSINLNQEARDGKNVRILAIASDQVGQRSYVTQTIRIGTCWAGNQSWDIIPLTQFQSPALLSAERLAEGVETVYFYLNYSYIGTGNKAIVESVGIAKACGTREIIDPRFNISCQVMPTGGSVKYLNNDKTLTYSSIQLGRMPGMERFLENDWKNFFRSLNNEMTFPLKITIKYKHDTDGDGDLESETQTTCEQVSYTMDNSMIDPRHVLPDWLLYDFVDFLQSSIGTLQSLQEKIDALLEYVSFACLTSFGLNTASQVYRRWITFWEEKSYSLKDWSNVAQVGELFQKNPLKTDSNDPNAQEDCKQIIETIAKAKGGFKIKYLTDADLKRCFPATANAWSNEEKTYEFMRWSCDRVFGHSAPAKWTENEKTSELIKRVQKGESCTADQSARGQPLRAENCRTVLPSFPQLSKDSYGVDDKCFVMTTAKGKSLFKLGKQEKDNIYQLEKVQGPADVTINYAIKKDDINYLTAQPKSCAEVCGISGGVSRSFKGPEGSNFKISEKSTANSKPKLLENKKEQPLAGCATVQVCRNIAATHSIYDDKGELVEVKSVDTRGFTSECFYNGGSADVVNDNVATREECCCINPGTKIQTEYYEPNDITQYGPQFTNIPVHETKEPSENTIVSSTPTNYEDMKFSYRYYKEKFEATGTDGKKHTQYNPNRYIDGRDQYACFGANHLLYAGNDAESFLSLGQPNDVLMLNPSQDYWLTVQCAHLAGINQRIQTLTNLMNSMSTCLIQVRTNGRGDAGACKELFTQYLCNSIWQAVRWFVDGCVSSGLGINVNLEEESTLSYLKGGVKGIFEATRDLEQTVSSEYGNAKLDELFGMGQEGVARKVCLAAFGYDWEINARSLLDAAYTTPFSTLVQPITRSREFLTVDPVSYKPKYEYRGSYIINPGCDFDSYNVYLSCIGSRQLNQYPNSISCSDVGADSIFPSASRPGSTSAGYSNCDCLGLADEKLGPLVAQGRLKQNVLEDKRAFHKVVEDNVRYDHLKFVLKPNRKIPKNIAQNCFPQGFEDGVFYFPLLDKSPQDIFDCRADPLSGSYYCGSSSVFADRKGVANFVDVQVNGNDILKNPTIILNLGENVIIDTTIRKVGTDKCLKAAIDGKNYVTGITQNGTSQYQIITNPLSSGTRPEISTDSKIRVEKVNIGNNKDVTINVRFFDYNNRGGPGDDVISFDGTDKVQIDTKAFAMSDLISSRQFVTPGDNNAAEAWIEDQSLRIKKQNADIRIIQVELPLNSNGMLITSTIDGNQIPNYGAPIVVRSIIQPETQTIQPKTLVLGLYHIKESLDAYEGPDSCNFNDQVKIDTKMQERKVNIKIEQKAIGTSQQGPKITSPQYPAMVQLENAGVAEIVTKITDLNGVRLVQMECIKPSGDKITINPRPEGNDGYRFIMGSGELNYAGKYGCTINAQSNNDKAAPSTSQIAFEVQCGPQNGNYGTCQFDGACKFGSTEVKNGLACYKKPISEYNPDAAYGMEEPSAPSTTEPNPYY